MKSKGFSLLEIIFSLLIISILFMVATAFFKDTLNKSKQLQLKNDILTIQSAINQYKNTQLLKNEDPHLYELDTNEQELFSHVLTNPILSSSDGWEKIDTTQYIYHINDINLAFYYNENNFLFSCDKTIPLCKEVLE
ncbi:MAG TPA: prepilin-type N-terminal cleavage/methylation domain-containing protein [Arcobacter sp.]|jgi:prepilin-type N-terminal cleavage/methylation domain-containing protein|nr:prepilin-type N-terminal cleavage/methylation domain-containing protein [Arcobacter sp.]